LRIWIDFVICHIQNHKERGGKDMLIAKYKIQVKMTKILYL